MSNPEIRAKVKQAFDTDELSEANSFATVSAIAAFEKGAAWLEELLKYVSENRRVTEDFLIREIPQIKAVRGEATYLIWLDLSGLKGDVEKFGTFLRSKTGLFLSPGRIFGDQGKSFLRMNIACPKSVLMEGLSRLKNGVEEWER